LIKSLGNLCPPDQESVDKIWSQVRRYLAQDEIERSHNFLISKACLTTMSRLAVDFPPTGNHVIIPEEGKSEIMDVDSLLTKQVYSFDEIQNFVDVSYPDSLRVHAFACLVQLSKREPSLFSWLLERFEDESKFISIRYQCMSFWADSYLDDGIGANCPSALFRVHEPWAFELRGRLFKLLESPAAAIDVRFRFSVFRLYQCIWGAQEKAAIMVQSDVANTRRRSRARDSLKSKKKSKKKN
jgi:hypothetical protein